MSEELLTAMNLPHYLGYHPPYLMLDRACVRKEGGTTWVKGYKLVSANESVFLGHFPNQAILPGVLQIAGACQCIVLGMKPHPDKFPVLKRVKNFKFRNPVIPGDRLDFEVDIQSDESSECFKGNVTCRVGDQVASQGILEIGWISFVELQKCIGIGCGQELPSEWNNHSKIDIEKIRDAIPHRFPFLLIDRAFCPEQKTDQPPVIFGLKNITNTEWCMRSPQGSLLPCLPGWALLEIAAQLGCVQSLSSPEHRHKLGIYMGVDEAQFSRPVCVGDQLVIQVQNLMTRGPFGRSQARITVNGEEVVNMIFRFAILEGNYGQ